MSNLDQVPASSAEQIHQKLANDGYMIWMPTTIQGLLDFQEPAVGATLDLFEVQQRPDTEIHGFTGQYSFLSNDALVPNNLAPHSTAEHLYQSFKTNKIEERLMVLSAVSAEEAREFGALVTLLDDWADFRTYVMEAVLTIKFGQREFREPLMATGKVSLVNENDYCDTFWGTCICPAHEIKRENQPAFGTGKNLLGILLMQIRNRFEALGATATMDYPMSTIEKLTKGIENQSKADRGGHQ